MDFLTFEPRDWRKPAQVISTLGSDWSCCFHMRVRCPLTGNKVISLSIFKSDDRHLGNGKFLAIQNVKFGLNAGCSPDKT